MAKDKVLSVVEANNIDYKILRHSDFGEIKSPFGFASLSKIPITKIAKSLLLKADDGYIMAVLPVSQRVDMEAVAQTFGHKKVSIAPLDELSSITGFERHATTAIGLNLPTVLDNRLLDCDVIYVATGSIGEELEIKPSDLVRVTNARVTAISSD